MVGAPGTVLVVAARVPIWVTPVGVTRATAASVSPLVIAVLLVALLVALLVVSTRLSRWARSARLPMPVSPRRSTDTANAPAPVNPRYEWLMDDNTLVRTGAVPRRGTVPSPAPDANTSAPAAASDPLPADVMAPPQAGGGVGVEQRRAATRSDAGPGKAPRLRIAMMGSRGIPASYSGFETCVEQLSVRLVERGHHVTVYCRSHHITWPGRSYRGVRLVRLPTIRSKHFDTIAHTFLSMLHGLFQRFDVVYVCGVGNAPLAFIPRLLGTPTAVNVDGADWQRAKWGGLARRYLRLAERAATLCPTCIVADSHVVEEYYQQHFQAPSVFIPYGSDVSCLPPGKTLERFGLQPDGYILWVGRLVPENNAHDVIAAYQQLGGPATGLALCIVGDAPYSTDYVAQLKADAGPGVVFTGYAFGAAYYELGANARVFAFASGVGGTHPALLEAMAFGNCVVVNDMPANLETVGDAAIPYHGAEGAPDLARALGAALADPALIEEYRQRAAQRAATVYSWDAVTDQYEALFARLAGR